MRIVGLACRCRKGEILPLDHFEASPAAGGCANPPLPVEWIRSILAGIEGDALHRDNRITATRLLGCPREIILLDNEGIVFDPIKAHSGHAGSVWHAEMERHVKGARTTVTLPPTPMFGIEVSGEFDKAAQDWSEIVDWKTHGESSMELKWQRFQSGQPDRELAAQLNIYRLAIARSILKVPDDQYQPRLIGWHLAMVRAAAGPGEPPIEPSRRGGYGKKEPPPPAFQVQCPIMSEDEIARVRPFDDERSPGAQPYTVREIVRMYAEYHAAVKAGMSMDLALRRHVPLVGRGMWGGKKCTRYCSALGACDKVEGIRR